MSSEELKLEIYDPSSLRKPESVADLGRDVLSLYHVFGHDVGRRGNLKLIEDDHIIYATSSSVVIEHLHSGKKQYVLGVEENGIGCVEVHPSRFASSLLPLIEQNNFDFIAGNILL